MTAGFAASLILVQPRTEMPLRVAHISAKAINPASVRSLQPSKQTAVSVVHFSADTISTLHPYKPILEISRRALRTNKRVCRNTVQLTVCYSQEPARHVYYYYYLFPISMGYREPGCSTAVSHRATRVINVVNL